MSAFPLIMIVGAGALLLASSGKKAKKKRKVTSTPAVSPALSEGTNENPTPYGVQKTYERIMAADSTNVQAHRWTADWLALNGRPDLADKVRRRADSLEASQAAQAAGESAAQAGTTPGPHSGAIPKIIPAAAPKPTSPGAVVLAPEDEDQDDEPPVVIQAEDPIVVQTPPFVPPMAPAAPSAAPAAVPSPAPPVTPAASTGPLQFEIPGMSQTQLPTTLPLPAVVPAAVPGLPEQPTPTASIPPDTLALAQKMLAEEGTANWKKVDPMVMVWQTTRGLVSDGKYGPGSAKRMAQEIGTLPLVRYWPRGSLPNTALPPYKAALLQIAMAAEEPRRSQLIASAEREKGQGFGTAPKPVNEQVVLEEVTITPGEVSA